jgi:hypothetical protein
MSVKPALRRRLDEDSRPIPVTTTGGVMPRWARDGRELFYLRAQGSVTR